MRPILALDTSTLTSSAALWDADAGVLVAEATSEVTTHSETLLPMIDAVVKRAGLAPRALAAVACGAGPGSFTGLRIGVATAKGLCYALGCPLIMVSSLAAVAAAAGDVGLLAVVLDAKKGQLFAGVFRTGTEVAAVGGEAVVPPSGLVAAVAARAGGAALRVAGDGLTVAPEVCRALGPAVPGLEAERPHAREVARLAARRLAAGQTDALATAEPRYATEWKSGDPNAKPRP
jgi:tRNA threonylcarbamoyladenosine biosynthesis protein TsaB